MDENNYLFVANRWLSKEEGDRQTVIELSPIGVEGALAGILWGISFTFDVFICTISYPLHCHQVMSML